MPLALFAQQEPPKGANAIIIATTLSDSLLYKKAEQVLIENGYMIGRSDKDSLRIQTEAKEIKGANSFSRFIIFVSEGKANVTGYLGTAFDRLSDPAKDISPITNRGAKDSPFKAAFDLMDEYAKSLLAKTDGSLTYETKP